MLRRSLYRLVQGERRFTFAGESPVSQTGGLPFYGNIYAGRVDGQNYVPPRQGGSGLLDEGKTLWDDPAIRSKMEACPYFSLCDQVLWHNMDPAYLDPGLLTPEEHHLLLLYSRAYYEKWKAIHTRPPAGTPRIRLRYGGTKVLDELCQLVGVPADICDVLKKEYFVDDASLIAMDPDLWSTAYLDPANMDQFSGRVLEFAGMTASMRRTFLSVIRQMRRLVIHRRDTESFQKGRGEENIILPYKHAVTLYDLHRYLEVPAYAGQLKVYDFYDLDGTQLTQTLSAEDVFFDYLVYAFYKPDFAKATLQEELTDDTDHTARYSITVEPFTVAERRIGRWF